MEYYKMLFDKRVNNKFVLKDFPGNQSIEYSLKDSDKLKDHTALYTIEADSSSYPDVIEAPVYMVSQEVKNVIELYDESVIFKSVSIINRVRKKEEIYFVLLTQRIDCLHETSSFRPDKSIDKLVLDKKKIGEKQIFKIEGIGPAYVCVSMDIAESLLRRDAFGITFEHIKSI